MSLSAPEFISYNLVVNTLAHAFITGPQTPEACIARGLHALGKGKRWISPLAKRYLREFSGDSRPRRRDVARFLLSEAVWSSPELSTKKLSKIKVQAWLLEPRQMQPVAAAVNWNVPSIESSGELAARLNVSLDELAWFADIKTLGRKNADAPLHHYHYRVAEKQSGGIRLIEVPQKRLKQIQRTILADILSRVPTYYNAAHGFVKGRSVQTFAAPHVGQRVVLRMDLENFFPRISRARVQAIFRTLGYPETVADILGALCTNTTPLAVLSSQQHPAFNTRLLFDARQLYHRPHLPQGAPTSPALANIAAYHLDCRLTGLAHWAGAAYTRYADDIALSGDDEFARHVERYASEVAAIASSEGWSVHHRKTRIMKQSVRQHLAGMVVNQTLNVTRHDFDTLKAILTNCVRHGASSQNKDGLPNFRAHLAGRIAWVASVNAGRGKRLRQIFDGVAWE